MHPFLLSSVGLFVIWLLLILVSKKTRKEQIIMSLIGLLAAPSLIFIATTDYQLMISSQPIAFGIDDLLFSFSLFGIAAIIYHVLLDKHMSKLRGKRITFKNPATHFLLHLILILGVWACLSLGAMLLFQINVVHGVMLGALMIGIYIIADRHDLIWDAILSGLMMAILLFCLEYIFFARLSPDVGLHLFQWNAMSSWFVNGIPLDEIVWAAVVGFTIGPMYEWLRLEALK